MHRVVLNFLRAGFLVSMFTTSFAQTRFEPGYIINQQGERIECLIRNEDSKYNPKDIAYKIGDSGNILSGSPLTIKEFEILGGPKYISANVKIDTSSVYLGSLSETRYPLWKEEALFLKITVRGTASLYSFSNLAYTRFFFNVKNGDINQLVYKEYLGDNIRTVLTNNDYMQQLWNEVKCPDTRIDQVKSLQYYEADLKSYFLKFNRCSGDIIDEKTSSSKPKRPRDIFNLKPTVGMNFAAVTISSGYYGSTGKINANSRRLGVEIEYVLPYNNNKWSLLLEPNGQSVDAKGESFMYRFRMSYEFIEFPIGLRYYSFLGEKIKFFFNAHYAGIHIGSGNRIKKTIISSGDPSQDIKIERPAGSFSVGAGFEFYGCTVEFRYNEALDLARSSATWVVPYKRSSLIFGYKIFRLKE